MRPFDFASLLLPAAVIFVAVSIATFRFTANPVAAIMSALFKSGVFLVYFGFMFDATYTVIDDWGYLEGASLLLDREVTVASVAQDWKLLVNVAGGPHVLYYLYNSFAFRLFGEAYYAPVACNIILTVGIAWLGARLAQRELGLTTRQSRALYLFLLVHPDIVAWSSIINAKDIVVLWTHVVLLYAVSMFYRRRTVHAIIVGSTAIMLLFVVRFYVPILFLGAFILQGVVGSRVAAGERGRYVLVVGVVAAVIGGVVGLSSIPAAISAVREDFVNPLFGIVRFMLTPVPFRTSTPYGFLDVPAMIHWMLAPFFLWGVVRVMRLSSRFGQFLVAYLAVFLFFYGVYGELQGPRHRVQLDYAWAVMQFVGLTAFGRQVKPEAQIERVGVGRHCE